MQPRYPSFSKGFRAVTLPYSLIEFINFTAIFLEFKLSLLNLLALRNRLLLHTRIKLIIDYYMRECHALFQLSKELLPICLIFVLILLILLLKYLFILDLQRFLNELFIGVRFQVSNFPQLCF